MSAETQVTVPRIDLDAIRGGRFVLFLGAAVHAPPPGDSRFVYPEEYRVPLAGALARQLAVDCGLLEPDAHKDDAGEHRLAEPMLDLQRVSLQMEYDHSRSMLVSWLRDKIDDGRQPSPALQMLAELPLRIIVTTNYDRLIEKALRKAGKDPRVFVYDPNAEKPTQDMVEDPSVDRPLVFKMHGDLDHPGSIVITDEDYINFIQRMTSPGHFHPVPQTVLFRMGRWPTLFVGYSLRDYNLRLLFRTLRWRLDPAVIPAAYSVDRSPDPLILKVWQDERRIVTFIAEDLWKFVPWLHDQVVGGGDNRD